jgi:hypothetical protein
MAINADFRSRTAEAAVAGYRIVKSGTAPRSCVQASAAADKIIGTSDGDDGGYISYAIGEEVNVAVGPVPKVRLGGTVVAGDRLTSDANGKAIATVTIGHQIIGVAEVPGVADDVITYLRSLGTV